MMTGPLRNAVPPDMDESVFRQLLSRHLGTRLGRPTLAKGAAYVRTGRVRSMDYVSTREHQGRLSGHVQGSAATPYLAAVDLSRRDDEARVDTHCTCPVGRDCKHVAAIVLAELENAPAAQAEPAPPQLGLWAGWLDALDAKPSPATPVALPEERRFGLILRIGAGALPAIDVQPAWLKPGQSGGYTQAQPILPGISGDPWGVLDKAQFELMAQLRMRSTLYSHAYRLGEARDEALLESLLAEYPCFMDRPSATPVVLGPQRALGWQWHSYEDGSQKLMPVLADASPKARLLRIGGLWYWEPAEQALGRVDADVEVAVAALRAPVLQPEQAALLDERWQRSPRLRSLPAPKAPAQLETHKVRPTPVLTLRAVPIAAPTGRYQAGALRLAFDYGGPRLPLGANPRDRRLHEGRLLDIVRDRARELATLEQLENAGFVQAGLLPRIHGLARDALPEDDFVLEHGRGQLAGTDQVFALATRLRELDFRLESETGFPYELVDEPDDWFAEIEESDNAWFDLRLGIDLGGERVDLLPILHRLLADPQFPLAPRKGEADDATWLVPLDERRRVPLPLARLRELIAPLLEWLGTIDADVGEGHLRLRRAQVCVLAELGPDLPWRGGERLRETFARLAGAHEPVQQPPGLRATLRPYQRDGLAWLGFLAEAGLGGVLADDMGLGKTVQVLAHLLAEKHAGRLDGPTLILMPTSLVANWRDEAARFAPDLSVLVLHGPSRAQDFDDIARHDLVLTTYPLLTRDIDVLEKSVYALLVLDEAQAIKNAGSQTAKAVRRLAATRRLAMTGTPLENHLGELWAQFDAVEPGLLGSERNFRRFYRTPIEKHGDAERRARLQRRIAPLLLRRRKEDVLDDLPPKTEIARTVELEGAQRELYETLRLSQHERVLAEVRRRGLAQSGIVVLDALLKLRQACCDPRLVKLEGARRVEGSAKLELLLDLLDGLVDEGRRVLVFSQFTAMLDLIGDALDARKLRWQRLTGETPARDRGDLVKRFQNGDVPVFLISLKAGGVGLNLTAADTEIHYDPWWNPAVEAQATDRAHRIGQDKPVFVYKLICAGTVEEKIQALQQRKAELAAAVLEGGSTQELRFEEADLAELFAPL